MAANLATNLNKNLPGNDQLTTASGSNVSTQEFYVRIPKTKKRYHALKFHIPDFDMTAWNKGEMARDATNQYVPRQDWEAQPKSGQGSEFNKEAKELARRRKFGYMPKRISPDDMPWIVSLKGNEKEKNKDKQYMGKKMITENSCFYIFAKCPDGGFEAHPLEDWYTFTAHKAYKTLNIEEAEEEYKRRHKILNKYLIMANKRKNEGEEDEEGDAGMTQKGGTKTFSFSTTIKTGKPDAKSDDEDSDGGKGKKKKNYKSSNLSDDDEDEETIVAKPTKKSVKKKVKTAKNSDDEEEIKTKEDSDDGDAEGLEKDYSSTGESDLESDLDKEEKYEEKGIDEEEPIKALDKSDDESESEEDEGLTEEGKAYRKLISKDGKEKEEENDEFSEFFRTGKTTFKKDPDEDSKDSNMSSGISEFDEDGEVKKNKNGDSSSSKLKRKATDDLGPKGLKKTNKNSASAPNMGTSALTHDESSSSSSTSAPPASKAQVAASISSSASKSSKTAAVIAAAEAAKQSASNSTASKPAAAATFASSSKYASSTSSFTSSANSNSIISEEEVRRYLSRKPMTTKELLQKFRGKTQNTLTKEQLLESLRIILERLHPTVNEKNGVKYLSLS